MLLRPDEHGPANLAHHPKVEDQSPWRRRAAGPGSAWPGSRPLPSTWSFADRNVSGAWGMGRFSRDLAAIASGMLRKRPNDLEASLLDEPGKVLDVVGKVRKESGISISPAPGRTCAKIPPREQPRCCHRLESTGAGQQVQAVAAGRVRDLVVILQECELNAAEAVQRLACPGRILPGRTLAPGTGEAPSDGPRASSRSAQEAEHMPSGPAR